MNNKLNKFAWLSVLLVGIISSVKIIHEPDIWWQIRTGQWIIENRQVPKVDVFSFTFLNDPWINVKWISEVLMATVNDYLGAEWLILLQMFCITLILFFCYKISSEALKRYDSIKNNTYTIGIMVSSLLMLFIINYRMNSRPEMFSHLLVTVFLYYLIKYSNSKSKWIYIIIPLQIVWTNTHEAYGMGIVLILIFLFSHWFDYFIYKKEKPLRYTIVGILAILSSAINPNGYKMIAHPFNIFGQLNDNKFTTELLGYKNADFWHYQSYLMLLVFGLCLLFILKKGEKKMSSFKQIIDSFGLAYVLIFLSFFYLSITSFRNIPFFIIVCTPLLANYIDLKFNKIGRKGYYTIIGVSILFYGMLGSNQLYNKLLPKEQFGINVNYESTPIGAANFLKDNNIKGKGFVDYLSSAYFLYELQPDYKSYIDLRDLDVFNVDFFKNVFRVYQAPAAQVSNEHTLWQYLNSLDELNYVVLLNSPLFKNLNNYIIHTDNTYELVYADNLNSIYLKRNNKNQKIIDKFGFSNGTVDVYHELTNYDNSNFATSLSKILWPFKNSKKKPKFERLRNGYYEYISTSIPKISK